MCNMSIEQTDKNWPKTLVSPECVARVPVSLWLKVCSLDVAFTTATVRGRSSEARMAVPMASSAKSDHFMEVSNAT